MSTKKILHIAPQNYAGMPYDFSKMQSLHGFESRLITIFRNTLSFREDITLGISIPTGKAAKKWRDSKIKGLRYCEPENIIEKFYFKFRDFRNKGLINDAIGKYKLRDFDIYHFDGGMDFFRDLRFAKEIKSLGKKIVCCYYGSDLRTRGIFRELDEMSDLNLTVEYDHTKLHKDINYIFFPFDVNEYDFRFSNQEKIRIIHSPTNRLYKGTDKILKVIEELKKEKDFEFILAENIKREELLDIKRECNLAIDQVGGESGGSGYGKNSIENLSMGLPTITEFDDDYLKFLPENPFITCNTETLGQTIADIIDNHGTLEDTAVRGRKWVEKYHSFDSVNRKITELYQKHDII